MNKFRTFISLAFLSFVSTVCYSQALSGLSYGLRAKLRKQKPFSYPRKVQTGILYTLNGRRTTNGDYVKRVLSGEHLIIDTLLVGLPDRGGQRAIVINYRPESTPSKP